MDPTVRARLRELTLQARRSLSDEARNLLEGVYGLNRQGTFAPSVELPAVQTLPEVAETRARLETYLADETAAGLARPAAVDKLVKEVAFTHLNRLVAVKLLESRKLLRGTVDKYHDSNAFKFYLAAHEDDLARYEAGTQPQDALGEGPRDTAYRHFLLAQYAAQAQQIRVLFDPDDLPSRLFPRPRPLRDLILALNSDDLAAAWAPGNEEAIGWVYQYFNEEEKAEVFGRLNKGAKIGAGEIPAATQLFTPNWIVRALVQNTLGRLWMQMHPDSRLADALDYLVPPAAPGPEGTPPVPLRPVREITLLDPACGTMHFGLVAFDLFAAMYQEEIERAGEPGWPAAPSVADPTTIPAAVVANNIHGIDIDLRAVQLAALTLLIKARSLNRDARLTDHNLACADVLLLNGPRLQAFLAETGFTRPIYDRLIRGLWARLKDSNQLGSLLRLETDLQDLIAAERGRFEQERAKPHLPGFAEEQFETEAGRQEFWDIIQGQILQAFDEFARRHAAAGRDERYFTGEASKGLRVLGLMLDRYDVVVANPPYMSARNMSAAMSDHLKTAYPAAKGDLYTAFIERCADFLADGGRLGMITQQSFMFISSYESLRLKLRGLVANEVMIHTGPHAFAEIGGEKVNTTLFALRREPDAARRVDALGTYFRLVREPDAGAKQAGFEQALVRLHSGEPESRVYRYRQYDFNAIPGAPWVYWITPGLLDLFKRLPKLGDLAQPRQGLATADNFRFLRYWWETGLGNVARSCESISEAQASGQKWFPYMKGGGFQRWWGNQEYVVNWRRDGAEIRTIGIETGRAASRPQNTEFFFRHGITYSYLTSGSFSARLSPGGFIFDVAGSSLFPSDGPLVLAVMNSSFAAYALTLINPTVNFQVGDLARLPLPTQTSDTIHALVDEAVALARAASAEDETTYDFVAPPAWDGGPAAVAARQARLAAVEAAIDEEVYRLYGIGAADRAAIEEEISSQKSAVSSQISEEGDEGGGAGDGAEEAEELAAVAPVAGDEAAPRAALAARWVSYAVGVALGRFAPGMAGALGHGRYAPEIAAALAPLHDADGLLVLDPGHPDDLAAKVTRVLDVLAGDAAADAILAQATGGKALREYLAGDFFKKVHVKQYRSRPVYWLFQSPKRLYNVYVFHERMTPDTLHRVRGGRYLGGKIAALREHLADLRTHHEAAPVGAPRKRLEKEIEAADAVLRDLEAFDAALAAVTTQQDERGTIAGWRPERDDGVLLNLAPLAALLPAWSVEPRKAWTALARGDYDWAATARRYWPDRVAAACRRNKSFALAHGMVEP